MALMVLGITGAFAFHAGTAAMELDGNVANDGAGVVGVADWTDLFNADTTDKAGGDILGAAGNLLDREFVRDFVIGASGPDPSYHEPSNKDDQPIFAAGGGEVWGCVSAANPTDKDDILNAYAIAYTGEGEDAGDLILSYGVERFDDSGTAFLGFWVFQKDVTCNTATGKFEGSKTDNDILMLINFSNGGDNVTVNAFAWHPGADPNSDPGTFTVLGSGVSCDIAVDTGPGSVNMCAITNGTGVDENVAVPWATEDKTKPGPPTPDDPNVLEPPEFVEGGINLTEAFEDAGITPPACFGSFMAETRSSDTLSATLKDFALGDLNTCNASISISGNGTNEVGTAHTFTVTATQDTGGGPVPATTGHVDVTLTGSNGITAGDIVVNAAASTCDDAGDNLNASGQCIIVFNSSVPGTVTGHATVTIDLGGGSTLVRDTNPATVGIGAGPAGSETPAVKNYVTGNITVGANDVNKVGDPHTFTVVANSIGPVAPTSIAISTSVSPTPDTTNTTTCASPTMSNGGKTATCTVTVNSSVPGVFTVNATATFTYAGGLSFQRDTDPVTASIGSGPDGSGPATKRYVNLRISIATSGTNPVGTAHTFTVTVEQDDGFASGGDGVNGWAPVAGANVLASESGVGDITGGTCDNTGGDTNASGQCTVIVNSSSPGQSTVNASTTVSVGGVSISVATNGSNGPGATVSNTKTWVNAAISIAPDATNEVGDPHTFTVTVTQDTGSGSVPVTVGNVDVTLTDANGAVNSIDAALSTCDDNQPSGDNLDANGQCVIVFSSATAGTVTGHATASLTVSGVAFTIATDGTGANSDDAVKTYVDARISIAADATNEVGDAHTFTVHVEENDGSGWADAAGELVTITFPGGAPGTVNDDDCDTAPGTDANGECIVVINSSVAGVFTAHAAANVQVGGLSLARETDGLAGNSEDAVKTYVDARISINPDDTNGIGEAHTFTVLVEENDGTGWANAAGEIVVITFPGGAPGTVDQSDCADGTAADGTCLVIINSNVAGTFNAHAASDVSVGGIIVHRETDGTGGNSDDAVKIYVDGSLSWLKHDNNGQLLGGATFEVCRTFDRFGVDIVDECVTIVDDVDGVDDLVGDQDGTPGEFKLDGLLLGTYTIEETVAPPTYTLDAFVETIVLTIASPDGVATHIWVNTPSGEGCTPGYWKNHTSTWDQLSDPTVVAMPDTTGAGGLSYTFITTTKFNAYFGLTPAQSGFNNNVTMLQAVSAGGGGEKALARHGVSALLNIAALDGYPLTDFIATYNLIRDAFINNTEQALADLLAGYNNLDHQNCPT